MNGPRDAGPQSAHEQETAVSIDLAARRAGLFLIATAVVSVLMVFARVAADADQPTLLESLGAIAQNRAIYAGSATARILSGITLLVGAWFLLRTWIIHRRLATLLVPYLLAISGVVTAFSGICALVLASSASADPNITVTGSIEAINVLRWLTGKIGFAIAGLAILVAARYQWKVGGTLRKIAPASAVTGLVMQFIWMDAVTIMHPIVGVAFMAWLLVVGAMLATGKTERHFRSMGG